MVSRLPALLPRLLVVALVALVTTAGFTYAAVQGVVQSQAPAPTQSQPSSPAVLVVPDLQAQAFVFAKGALQDAGFAWRVTGPVEGFAANIVASQSPAAGTRVIDTGAPAVTVTLKRNPKYDQIGEPEQIAPYHATPLRLADAAVATLLAPPVSVGTKTVKTVVKPKAPATPKPARKTAAPARYPQNRPVAFVVPGARKEPLDEMPLPDRARALGTWIAGKPALNSANMQHWLYQNAWIVAGARFGWWRGDEALATLVDVDRRTVALWGVGGKSEAVAEHALAQVRARSKSQ
jgi:beta-lactam-binding protein with PASTA domain